MDTQIVNFNNLEYTRNLISDLNKQNHPFLLRVIDQNSSEEGTEDFLYSLTESGIEVIASGWHIDLSWWWNDLYMVSDDSLLCFLNNDLRIPYNFVDDTVKIFEMEPEVGCVVHATNHINYQRVTDLQYVIMKEKIAQGWAFTMRKEAYTFIPDEFGTFGGDDFLFHKLYEKGWKVAMCLSSPIIHYYGQSRKYYKGDRQKETALTDLGYKSLPKLNSYTERHPKFERIIDGR